MEVLFLVIDEIFFMALMAAMAPSIRGTRCRRAFYPKTKKSLSIKRSCIE
jgi:hypothetical protein